MIAYKQCDEREEDARQRDVDDVVVWLALEVEHKEKLRVVDARMHAVADLLPHHLRTDQVPHAYAQAQ